MTVFLQCAVNHRDLHSFPTRRSSDLSNIIMRNVTGPIGIGFSGTSDNNNTQDTQKPFIRNIVFNAIRATVVAKPVDHPRSEEHTSELQSQFHLVCRLLLEKKNHLQHY